MGHKKQKARHSKKKQIESKKKSSQAKSEGKAKHKNSNKMTGTLVEDIPAPGSEEGSIYGVIGLANLRNTCYFNSVLQVLVSSQRLQRYYGDQGHSMEPQCGALAVGMRDVFAACKGATKKSGKSHIFRPSQMLEAIRKVCPTFKAKHQHDAHELMSALIQELVEEEVEKSRQRKKHKDTFVAGKFCGEFGSSLSCQNCSYVKTNKEDFFGISVPIVKFKKATMVGKESINQDQASPEPSAGGCVTDVAVGPVMERTDAECTANLLGGDSEQEQPTVGEYVSVTIGEQGVSLKVVEQRLSQNFGYKESCPSSNTQDNKEISPASEDQLDASICRPEECIPSNTSGMKQIDDGVGEFRAGLPDQFLNEQSQEDSRPAVAAEVGSHNKPEDTPGDFEPFESEFTEVRRKGKKGRKVVQKTKEPEFLDSHCATSNLKTIGECLDEYFSPELVYWKCPKEFPTRRVHISDGEPEVFAVPRKDPCRIMTDCPANRFSALKPKVEPSDSSDEDVCEAEGSGQSNSEENLVDGTSSNPVSLPPAKNLKSCLKKSKEYSEPVVQAANSTKHCKIWTIPDVLLIHLKRFEVNSRGRMTKLNQHIEFDKDLDLKEFCEAGSPDINVARYVLKGVICHSGGLFGGHYVAYVLRSFDSPQWYYVSDHDVQQVKEANVMASQAYILMYERICTDLDMKDEVAGLETCGSGSCELTSEDSIDENHGAADSSNDSVAAAASCTVVADCDAVDEAQTVEHGVCDTIKD